MATARYSAPNEGLTFSQGWLLIDEAWFGGRHMATEKAYILHRCFTLAAVLTAFFVAEVVAAFTRPIAQNMATNRFVQALSMATLRASMAAGKSIHAGPTTASFGSCADEFFG